MKTYNKGEWSELYTICSVLHDRIIKIGDNNLQPTKQYIKVLQLLMKSIAGEASYDTTSGDVAVIVNGKIERRLRIDKTTVENLFDEIRNGSGRSFSIPLGDKIMDDLMLEEFKANSYQKTDLDTISIMPTETEPRQIGFSVKSQVGGLSTLLNASKSTNFIYEVVGFNGDIDEINALSNPAQVMKRIRAIRQAGGEFVFSDTENQTFNQNLRLTDSLLPHIIAHMLLDYFSNSGVSRIDEITTRVALQLPFPITSDEIAKKMKDFLSNITLGMVPTREWDGSALGGGCIFVKGDGDIVCFTLYDIDQFKDYLFNNTKFDTASTTRHEFGSLYRENDDKLYFKLNLDIRFVS